MKKALLIFILLTSITLTAQNDPVLIIDNVNITIKSGVSLPYWLKAGQTIDLGPNSRSASIIEFTVDNNNLVFSQAVSLTSAQTVPANKVWKIEGIGVTTQNSFIPSSNGLSSSSSSSSSTANLPTIFQSPKKFETVGTYSWTVPPSVTSICVEVWGAGGGGSSNGGGGNGGGYSYQCFTVVPGTNYSITIGAGGTGGSGGIGSAGGASSFGNLLNATGGDSSNVGIGTYTNGSFASGGVGGSGGNGGIGGNQGYNGNSSNNWFGGWGQNPGGGGGGSIQGQIGGNGARGQVYIYW